MNQPSLLHRGQALWLSLTHLIEILQAPAALAARVYLADRKSVV